MTTILDPLPNPRILSLLLTLQCNASCKHCGTDSNPHVKLRLPPETAARAIAQAVETGYRLVAFTGGEPMMYGPALYPLIEQANQAGLSTRVVTNAFWARDDAQADRLIAKLKRSGLREINFSTGDEHAKYVPVENIIRATRAGLGHGLAVSIMVEVVKDRSVSRDGLLPALSEALTEEQITRIHFCESPWMPLDEFEVTQYPEGIASNRDTIGTRVGCDSIINTTTVMADGKIMACCGLGTRSIPELHVGDVDNDSFAEIYNKLNMDFLKKWIKIQGPERILAWAATKDPSIVWENMYAHRCQACKRIYSDPTVRKVIRDSYTEKVLDVLVEEWLLYGYRFSQSSQTA